MGTIEDENAMIEDDDCDKIEDASPNLSNGDFLPRIQVKVHQAGDEALMPFSLDNLPSNLSVSDLKAQILSNSGEIIRNEEEILEISLNDQILMEDSVISNLLEDQRNEDIEIKVLLKQEEPELSPPRSHRISRSKTRRVMQDLEIYKEKM